jgi:hypothetical protein
VHIARESIVEDEFPSASSPFARESETIFLPLLPAGVKFSAEMSGGLVSFAREKCEMYRSKGVRARFFRAFTSSRGCARVRVRALRAVIASSSLSAVFVFFSSLVGNLSLSLSLKNVLLQNTYFSLLLSSNTQVKREV